MANIIIRKSGGKSNNWQRRKDYLHNRRKQLTETLKDGIMSRGQMMKGETKFMNHDEQVAQYDKWRNANEGNMREWSDINKEFKKNGEEGRVHSIDDIRDNKVIYD